VDNLWTIGAPGAPGETVKFKTPKLPKKNTSFLGFLISVSYPAGRARGFPLHGNLVDWLISAIYFPVDDWPGSLV